MGFLMVFFDTPWVSPSGPRSFILIQMVYRFQAFFPAFSLFSRFFSIDPLAISPHFTMQIKKSSSTCFQTIIFQFSSSGPIHKQNEDLIFSISFKIPIFHIGNVYNSFHLNIRAKSGTISEL